MSGSVYNTTKRSNVGPSYYALDINQFVTAFLQSLQNRNLKAVSETAIGSMIINTFTSFTLGEGLEPQASPETQVTGWTEEQRSTFISQAESFFRRYAGSKRIDHYGKLNFYQLQNIALRNCLVDGASAIASFLGVSDSVIALTIVSAGTSAPELAASVMAARKGDTAMALGNVVGSCIFNVFFVLGIAATVHPLGIGGITYFDIATLLGASCLLWLFCRFGKTYLTLTRSEGVIMTMLAVAYYTWLVIQAS